MEIEKLWALREEVTHQAVLAKTTSLGDPAAVSRPTLSRNSLPGARAPSSPQAPEVTDANPVLGDLRGLYCRTVSA